MPAAKLSAIDAWFYETDKSVGHSYVTHYQTHFAPLRLRRLNILEIGIGGYEDPEAGGGSLRMWRTYFPHSRVFGIDIYEKNLHSEPDGSHFDEHVIRTFQLLFPRLSDDGIYVVEDTQTSYWRDFGGSSTDLNRETTTMGFFKKLIDGLNHAEFEHDYTPTYFDESITAIHFYHHLVFVQKGRNDEASNVLGAVSDRLARTR